MTASSGSTTSRAGLNRVPPVTPVFWVVKVLTTGMGETTSDYLVRRFAPELVVPLALLALIGMLALQLCRRRYVAAVYWTTALAVSVFGTMVADVLHVGLHVPYAVSSAGFAVVLAAVLVVWHRVEGTLSMHAITTRRRECFYWATVLVTFALGTAVGDWTAATLGLGYLASGVLFAVVIVIPAALALLTSLNRVLLFWFAYVLTRPLGASFADRLGAPRSHGGLALGTGPVSAAALGIFVALVGVLTLRDRRARASASDRGSSTTSPG